MRLQSVSVCEGFDSSICKSCRLQIPMESDSSRGLSCAPGILTMLPQHVNATPPTCGTWPGLYVLPISVLHQRGILINLPLSHPISSIASVYYIESTARKSDTFSAVVSFNQESASGQVNQLTLFVGYFQVWDVLIHPGNCHAACQ